MRTNGFKIPTARAIAAACLLDARELSLDGPQARAAAYQLGPVLCTSADEQRRFRTLVDNWAAVEPKRATNGLPSDAKTSSDLGKRTLRWLGPVLLLFALAVLLGTAAYFQQVRPRAFDVQLTRDGAPASDVLAISSTWCKGQTDTAGRLACRAPATGFPLTVSAIACARQLDQRAFADLAGWRAWLHFAPLQAVRIALPSARTPCGGAPTAAEGNLLVLAGSVTFAAPPRAMISPDERPVWPAAAGAAFFAILFGAGLLWLQRGARLERRRAARGRHPLRLSAELPLRLDALTNAMRALGLSFRQPQREFGNQLDVRRTVEASARRAGLFSGVYGAPRERRFLALVRRQALQDHQAFIGETLVAELCRSGADVLTFCFDADANVIVPHAPETDSSHKRHVDDRRVFPLIEHVLSANEHAECLLFCEPAALIDPISGFLTCWCRKIVDSGHRCTVLTVAPPQRRDAVHAILHAQGIQIVSLEAASLGALAHGLAQPAPARCGTAGNGALDSDYRLMLTAPPAPEVAALCDAMCGALGYAGFKWVQACAVYPEIQWPLTNAVGALLVPDDAERARLLPRVAGLVWFRKAYMPDWLRAALIARLDEPTSAKVRDYFWSLFARELEAASSFIEVSPASPDSPASPSRSRWLRWLRWLRVALALSARAQSGARSEQLFARYLLGWNTALSMRIPRRIMNAFNDTVRGPAIVLGSFCIAGAGLSALYGTAAASGAEPALPGAVDATVRFAASGTSIVLAALDRGTAVVARRTLEPEAAWQIVPGISGSRADRVFLSADGSGVVQVSRQQQQLGSTDGLDRGQQVLELPAGRTWFTAFPATTDTAQRYLWLSRQADGRMYAEANFFDGNRHAYFVIANTDTPDRVAVDGSGTRLLLMRRDATELVQLGNGPRHSTGAARADGVIGSRSRVAWDRNGEQPIFAECSSGGSLAVWSAKQVENLKLLRLYQAGPGFTCSALAVSPGGRHIAIGSTEGQATLIDTATENAALSLTPTGPGVTDLSFDEATGKLALVRSDLSTTVFSLSMRDRTVDPKVSSAAAGAAADASASASARENAGAAAAKRRPRKNASNAGRPAPAPSGQAPPRAADRPSARPPETPY